MNQAQKPLWAIFAALMLVLGFSAYRHFTRKAEVVAWFDDLDDAKAESAKTGRPIFAYFTAEWCPPCQEMKATTFASAEVKRALESSFVPVKIDVDRHSSLAVKYEAYQIPMLLILDSSGKILRGGGGYIGPDEMIRWLAEQSVAIPVSQPASQPATQPK